MVCSKKFECSMHPEIKTNNKQEFLKHLREVDHKKNRPEVILCGHCNHVIEKGSHICTDVAEYHGLKRVEEAAA